MGNIKSCYTVSRTTNISKLPNIRIRTKDLTQIMTQFFLFNLVETSCNKLFLHIHNVGLFFVNVLTRLLSFYLHNVYTCH